MTMIDEKFALLRTHRNNIARYRRLLETKLTEYERQVHREAYVGGALGDGTARRFNVPSRA